MNRRGSYLQKILLFSMLLFILFSISVSADTTNTIPPNLQSYPSSSVPSWLDTGSNAWMLVAATLVGLQSIPGVALFYAGLTKKKYTVNTMFLIFYAFAAVLLVWIIAGFNFGFGYPSLLSIKGLGILGYPVPAWQGLYMAEQAVYGPSGTPLNIPMSTYIIFQFVFAAITPILLVGSVIERINYKAWMIFVPIWSLLVYSPLAYWLFAGGWLNQLGAVDFSGGYVIHLNAGIGALAAALAVGPRLAEERKLEPHNLSLILIGTGLIWLGWNGFNGGDPGGATIDAAIAVLNTDLAAAVSAITWIIMDMKFFKKPTLVGAATGAITGLVAITPAAGYVDAWGSIIIGIASGSLPWLSLYKLEPKLRVDDTLGVFSSHGIAGLVGGLLTGVFADPSVSQYILPGLTGALYGNLYQLGIQAFAALIVTIYTFFITYGLLKLIGLFVPLRASESELKVGDYLMHGEVAYSDLLPNQTKEDKKELVIEQKPKSEKENK
ncbi:ammonium transporter [Sulfolobus acidocaldarius SUSAZ]|nr:ammonium transporter [Sulfolobus acidocaldarius SUSAZ]